MPRRVRPCSACGAGRPPPLPHASLTPPSRTASPAPTPPCSEAELRQIRKASLLSTVNNLVFGGGPILISLGGARAAALAPPLCWPPRPLAPAMMLHDTCPHPCLLTVPSPPRSTASSSAPVRASLRCPYPAPPPDAAFVTYWALGYPLTASVAFPALALFNLLRFPVMMFPAQVGRSPRAPFAVVSSHAGSRGAEGAVEAAACLHPSAPEPPFRSAPHIHRPDLYCRS